METLYWPHYFATCWGDAESHLSM